MSKLLLEHALFLHHLNDSGCWHTLINLSQQTSTEYSHVFMHGSDFRTDDSYEVIRCFITDSLLASILDQVDAPLHHQLEHELLHVEVFLRHDLLLSAY